MTVSCIFIFALIFFNEEEAVNYFEPQLPANQLRSRNCMDLQAIRAALVAINGSTNPSHQEIKNLRAISSTIQTAEAKFREVCGVPYLLSGTTRSHQLGKILAVIKDNEDAYEKVADGWVLHSSARLESQAVGLQFLFATLSCWGYQYPLSDEPFLEKLVHWCNSSGASAITTLHDPPPADEIALLEEERAVYAHGLLAIAMSSVEYADEAVRTPAAPYAAQYLRRSLQQPSPSELQNTVATFCGPPVADAEMHTGPATAAQGSLAQQVYPLRKLRMCICCQILSKLGEYVEAVAPILQEGGVESLVKLLQQYATDSRLLYDTLDALCALLAHRRFAELFIAADGVQLLLQIPRSQHSFNGLSLALYGLASLPEAFERVCMLPAPTIQHLVQAALQLLGSGYDAARKNAALFLGSTIHFRAMLEAFDEQGGVRQLLSSLRAALILFGRDDAALDQRMERQIAQYVCHTLLHWLRAHLVLHASSLRRPVQPRLSSLNPSASTPIPPPQPLAYKPVGDVANQEAMNALLWTLDVDRRLAEGFVRLPWTALETFVSLGGVELLLEVVQDVQPLGERSSHELIVSALQGLQLAALSPYARRAIAGTMMPNTQRPGIGILLSLAAQPATAFSHPDYEIVGHALHVLTVCLAPPPSLASLLSYAEAEAGPPASVAVAVAGQGRHHVTTDARLNGEQRPQQHRQSGQQQQQQLGQAQHQVRQQQGQQLNPEQQHPSQPQSAQPTDDPNPTPQLQQSSNAVATSPEALVPLPVPSAAVRLASAIEAGYSYVRQCVRAGHGIRLLKQLLQPRPAAPSHFLGQHAPAAHVLEKVRALAAQALLGMARDPPTRHVLSRLQVGRLLAELVRDPHNSLTSTTGGMNGGMGLPRTPAAPRTQESRLHAASAAEDSGTEGGAGGRTSAGGEDEEARMLPRNRLPPVCGLPGAGGARTWPEAFHRASMELIALTATNTAVGRIDRVAAAAHDAAGGGPALHRLEKAAIAAATPLTYAPQELLLLIYEHLRASGLHSAATTLAKEAHLHRAQQVLASMGVIAPPAYLPLLQQQLHPQFQHHHHTFQQQQQQPTLALPHHPFTTPQIGCTRAFGEASASEQAAATEGAKSRGGGSRSRSRRHSRAAEVERLHAAHGASGPQAQELQLAPASASGPQVHELQLTPVCAGQAERATPDLAGVVPSGAESAQAGEGVRNGAAGSSGRTRRRKGQGGETACVGPQSTVAAGVDGVIGTGAVGSQGDATHGATCTTPHFTLHPAHYNTTPSQAATPSLHPAHYNTTPSQAATPSLHPAQSTSAPNQAVTPTLQPVRPPTSFVTPIPVSAHLKQASKAPGASHTTGHTPNLFISGRAVATPASLPQHQPTHLNSSVHPSGFASPAFALPAVTQGPPPSLAPPFSSSLPLGGRANKHAGPLLAKASKGPSKRGENNTSVGRGSGGQAHQQKGRHMGKPAVKKECTDSGGVERGGLKQESGEARAEGEKERRDTDTRRGMRGRGSSKARGSNKRKAEEAPPVDGANQQRQKQQKPRGGAQPRYVSAGSKQTEQLKMEEQHQQLPNKAEQQQQQQQQQHRSSPRSSKTKPRKDRHPDHPRSAKHTARTQASPAPFSFCTTPAPQQTQPRPQSSPHLVHLPHQQLGQHQRIDHPAQLHLQHDQVQQSHTPAPAPKGPAPAIASSHCNPLLTNLPSRNLRKAAGPVVCSTGSNGQASLPTTAHPLHHTGQQHHHEHPYNQQQPHGPPLHVQAAAAQLDIMNGTPVSSKLNTIVTTYLRQMHRQACMQSNTPIAVLPPVPLSKSYSLPQPSRASEAPANVSRRVAQREAIGGHGGRGGVRADRQMVYSRFRPLRTFRCDGSFSMCAAFAAKTNLLVVGCHSGELTVHDVHAGEIIDAYEGHMSPVHMLRSISNPFGADPDATLLLSSCKSEVKLWDGLELAQGAVATWEGATKASFSSNASKAIGVLLPHSGQSTNSTRQAAIWDVRTHHRLLTLEEPIVSSGNSLLSPGFDQRNRSVPTPCFGPSPDSPLVLWGASLWDIRCPPRVLHTFDVFSETRATSSCFNPAGHPEAVLNSEVWDLRTFKLLRSVPALDGTQLTFSGNSSVAYATLRRTSEELGSLLAPRRARHNLHSAFRVLDPSNAWGELATVDMERAVVDLATEESDSLLAVVCMDTADGTLTSNIRLLEVGRQRMADDSSDEEDGDSQSREESDEEVVDSDFLSGSDGDSDDGGTPHNRLHRALANGGLLTGAARRVAGALGRMERQRQVEEDGSNSDGWEDEEAQLRAQMMMDEEGPLDLSAMVEGEEDEQGDGGSSIEVGSEDDEDLRGSEFDDDDTDGVSFDEEDFDEEEDEDGGSFNSADFDAAFLGGEGEEGEDSGSA